MLTVIIGTGPQHCKGYLCFNPTIQRCGGEYKTICRTSNMQLRIYFKDNFYNYCLSEAARRDRALDAARVSRRACSIVKRCLTSP